VQYPGAIKAFAKEVCRNDLLNFGRLHFFFPDSRLALDLNTDKTLKVRARAAPAGAKPAPPGPTGAQAVFALQAAAAEQHMTGSASGHR